MTAPSFIQEAETVWNTSTTPKTTASFNVLTSDVLVAFAVEEGQPVSAMTVAGGSLSWTPQQIISVAGYAWVGIWTAIVDSNKAMTVTFSRNTPIYFFGGNVLTFRGSDGVGASNKTNVTNGAPTLDLLTTQANSAIVVCNGDWTAKTGARTWRTNAGALTEVSYFSNGSQYGLYGGYHADAGAIATYAVGLSAPTGQTYSIVAVEVKGTASGGSSTPLSLSASLTPAGLLARRVNKPFAGII